MQTREFPPEVFARLAPDIYFKRHLENGLRPTGRKFLERRQVDVRHGDSDSLKAALGSAVVRAGGATVVCGITGGLTKFTGEGGVYANVEIHRGGMAGNPTGEEQVLSMNVHRLLKASKLDQGNFIINDQEELCLNAQIIVLSRTGPMLDLVWDSLVAALRVTRIPEFVQDERTLELVPTENMRSLHLPNTLADKHLSYGVCENLVLADIDGSVEEECVRDRVTVARSSSTGALSGFSISAPNGCSISDLRSILDHTQA